MRLFKKLRKKLDYLTDAQIESIHRAFTTALKAHDGQKRRSGEPYITHPVDVACILADQRMDAQTIMAALLHDVIEDTDTTKEELAGEFGSQVAELVDGVSKLTQIEFISRVHMQAENFRKMVLAMSKDIRVILVKLADRLHNMRTLGVLRPEKRRRIGQETLQIYAPIARRLGMRDISVELEELSFEASHPRRYEVLKHALAKARGNRKKILKTILSALEDALLESKLPACKIIGREKHLYSIYRKMRDKKLSFAQVMDVYAFRVIVDDTDTCYRVLGIVHSTYKPVLERFKDYIAIPKTNGYQSLHTTLFGPYGLPIEIQIRTTEMDRMANNGIAAHWSYKGDDQAISDSRLNAQQWVANLLDLQQRAGSSEEFIESVKVDLFPDEIYVFTPKGEILQLPAQATPIDFAYTVHTGIGNTTAGVKIDRHAAALSTPLVNGQTVEIITSPIAHPSPAWLDFVVTGRARSGIRHFLKSRKREDSIKLGKQLLMKALSAISVSWRRIAQKDMSQLLKKLGLESLEQLFEEIGLANRVAAIEAQRIATYLRGDQPMEVDEQPYEPLVIKGTEGVAISLANCCNPLPPDAIVGLMRSGHGMAIHRDACPYIGKLRARGEPLMMMRWDDDIDKEFPAVITIEAANQRGILATMALAVSDAHANIDDINVTDKGGSHYHVALRILVTNRKHLANVIRRLRQISAITKVIRKK